MLLHTQLGSCLNHLLNWSQSSVQNGHFTHTEYLHASGSIGLIQESFSPSSCCFCTFFIKAYLNNLLSDYRLYIRVNEITELIDFNFLVEFSIKINEIFGKLTKPRNCRELFFVFYLLITVVSRYIVDLEK